MKTYKDYKIEENIKLYKDILYFVGMFIGFVLTVIVFGAFLLGIKIII